MGRITSSNVCYTKFLRPVPEALKNKKTALYGGARDPEWILIIEASKILKDWTFIVICPEIPPTAFNEHVARNNFV